MFDVNDDAEGAFRRVEVLTGPGRRRRWSADEKAPIVAETLLPGAQVSEVARRRHVCPQRVFGWLREMRVDHASAAAGTVVPSAPAFVPIVTDTVAPAQAAPESLSAAASIEIAIADAVVRVLPGLDGTARADRVKSLVWDSSWLALVWKQLQHGAFRWPPVMDGVMKLSSVEFVSLFDGLDCTRVRATKGFPQPSVAA